MEQTKERKYTIGLDYGTLSVRALLLDIETGEEAAGSVFEYLHGVMETQLPAGDPSFPGGKKLPAGFALQHPQDYVDGMIHTIREVMTQTQIRPEQVVGIGIDFTSSTVLPVRADGTPLCQLPDLRRSLTPM